MLGGIALLVSNRYGKQMTKKKRAGTSEEKYRGVDPRQALMKSYAGLTEFKKDVLEVLSLFYMPVGMGKLSGVLRSRGARDETGLLPNSKTIRSVVVELEREGLVASHERGVFCARPIVELLTRCMVDAGRFNATIPFVHERIAPRTTWSGSASYDSIDHAIANLRLAVYSHDFVAIDKTLDTIDASPIVYELEAHPLTTILTNPFDSAWLETYPSDRRNQWLLSVLQGDLLNSATIAPLLDYVREHLREFDDEKRATLNFVLLDLCFLQGRFDEVRERIEAPENFGAELCRARYWFLTGKTAESLEHYEACLALLKKTTHTRKPVFSGVDWLYFILALLETDTPDSLKRARELASWGA